MKKILYIFICLLTVCTYSQSEHFGGIPVNDIKVIERENIENINSNFNRIQEQNSIIAPSSPTGSSLEVGATEGQLSVSLTGGASYNIHIAVPPGINGIVPQISLSYNSQAGNGLAGYGWNVTGVSVITKIPSTKFHDDTIDGVDFDNLDRFALDGQRLIVKSGTSGVYGANGTEYETESFSKIKIKSLGVHPSGAAYGPMYFVVEYPDGSIAHYGNSSTSRTLTDWAIMYWQNPQGVRISYNYILSNNSLSISSIRYGTRLTVAPINEIAFVYKSRQRSEQSYVGGQSFVRNTILSEINVKGNNIGFRNYVLTHNLTSLGYQRLIKITEKSGDNTMSFNPTVFSYEDTNNNNLFGLTSNTQINLSELDNRNCSNISGDFDGDGKMDVIIYPTFGFNANQKYWLFNGLQTTNVNYGYEHSIGQFHNIFSTSWLSSTEKLMPMQGWCVVQTTSSNNLTTFKSFSKGITSPILLQDTKSYEFPRYVFGYTVYPCNRNILSNDIKNNRLPEPGDTGGGGSTDPVYNTITRDIPKEFLDGDFNGDGITDVIVIEKPLSGSYWTGGCNGVNAPYVYPGGLTYFMNLDKRLSSNYIATSGSVPVTINSKFLVADYNGDGKTDVYIFENTNVKVYSLNNQNQLFQIATFSDINIQNEKPRYMGDFNGDGKIDFVIPQLENADAWCFFLSKGDGSFRKICTTIGVAYKTVNTGYYGVNGFSFTTLSLNEHSFITNDFNGDGKTDILYQQNLTIHYIMTDGGPDTTLNGQPMITKLVLLENIFANDSGIGFNLVNTETQFAGIKKYPIPIFLDHNNRNQNLEYGLISGNSIRTFNSKKDSRIDTRLKEIVQGNGVKDVIAYAPLKYDNDSSDNIFSPSTYTENYPNFDISSSAGFQVVSKIENRSATHYKQQNFKYHGAVTNVNGLGFLGFRSLARTNWFNSDFPVITSVSKHDIAKRGAVNETYTVIGNVSDNFANYSPSTFINKNLMNNNAVLLPNKVFKVNNTFTISSNGLEGTSKEITTLFDNDNFPLTTTTVSKNGGTIERTEVVNIEYFPTTTSPTYIVGRLKKKNSSVTHNGDTMTGEEIYTYNTAHLVSKIQKKGHLTNYLTEDNIYDIFGNITQKKITAVGLTPRITNFTYDTTGRFLLTSKDIEGLITAYTYNTSNGLLLTQTLPSNDGYPLRTTYLYDVWGKKTKETDYLGKSLFHNYSWLNPGSSGFFAINTTGEDNSASYTQLDDIGRKIAEGYKTINDTNLNESNIIWNTFEYDIYDRAIISYEPKLSTTPEWSGLHNKKIYDVYGRTIQTIDFKGKTTNFNYIGLTTTSSDGISNSNVVKNSIGNITSMTDNGGTITYQYYANGNLKQSNFGGVIVAIEQDGWGRKTKLSDPSAGTYEYQYNEFGEMKKEITPKGVTNYSIDDFGKVTEKTIIGTGGDPTNSKTTYTFNPTTKLLTNTRYDDFAGGFFTLYSYGYDNFKRVNFTDESGFNTYYQRATQFDAFGRPEKELYTAVNTSNSKQSSKWVKNTYKNGHHWQILDDATSQVLWQTTKVNARGQLTNGNYGNGISVANTYNQYGFATQFKHDKTITPVVNVMTLNTVFEPQRGNLMQRYNSMFDFREDFTYDNLDRLSSWDEKSSLVTYSFNTNTEGFESTSAGVSVTHQNSPFIKRLVISSDINLQGVQKMFRINAVIGEKLNINGSLVIKSSNPGTVIKYVIVERNPSTGATVEFVIDDVLVSNNLFSFEHIVNQYSEIYMKYIVENEFTNPNIIFYLDEISVTISSVYNQSYDSLGRIETNNVGTYNYTNVHPVTTVPKHFQNSSIVTSDQYNDYYQSRANLDISYNAFKSPIDIIEEGKDKLSFIYNMNNSRSTMYYGSLEADKLSRRYRKHYATDGSMEIRQDMVNGAVEFITYIGGDAYSAPVVLKSDGTTQNYLYLHRDYLGSIIAITNQAGAVVEKRHFDAWGNITKVQDGSGNNLEKLTFFDRGYTGHEHLQGINLIHMNGRLYDPVVHRFLQPDNFVQDTNNTQCFNRYSYALNNPLKYTDPSGEVLPALAVAAIIGAVAGGAGYIAHAIQTGDWSWGGFGMAVVGGGAVGALTGGLAGASATSVTLSAAGNAAASSFVGAFFPAINIPIGDWSLSFSPSIAFGNASGVGASFSVSYSDGDWSFSGGVGIMSNSNYNGFGANANEIRYSILANYDDGKTGFSLGTNIWRGSSGSDGNNLNQRTGMVGFHNGDFRAMYENDGSIGPLGDGGDKFRSAALNLSVGDYSAGFNLMTGKRDVNYEDENLPGGYKGGKEYGIKDGMNRNLPNGAVHEVGNKYRLGALSVGYKGYKLGVNSEKVRHAIQNHAIHNLSFNPFGIKIINKAQRGFENQSWDYRGYFQYRSPNIFTSW